jgi:hypothetical protein
MLVDPKSVEQAVVMGHNLRSRQDPVGGGRHSFTQQTVSQA